MAIRDIRHPNNATVRIDSTLGGDRPKRLAVDEKYSAHCELHTHATEWYV